jgi:murein DD-endopeptidase MepM/ murein hydrolase activator NlpD
VSRLRLIPVVLLVTQASACSIPRWPVQGPVSSDFGLRFDGVLPGLHRGIDIVVPTGTEVHAMAAGTVRFAGVQAGYGNVVWLDHGGEVLTVYAHLSEVRVSLGQVVGNGAVLGLSGMTGDATGPHLHFEVWRWGIERDPVPLLGGFPSER